MSMMVLSGPARTETRSAGQRILQAVASVGAMFERIQQRQALAQMSDEMLKDIGLSRADVYGECRKKFWQV